MIGVDLAAIVVRVKEPDDDDDDGEEQLLEADRRLTEYFEVPPRNSIWAKYSYFTWRPSRIGADSAAPSWSWSWPGTEQGNSTVLDLATRAAGASSVSVSR
jgi:hypothetical protein